MANYIKANNTNNLNLASSWTANSGFPSLLTDTATWNSTVTGANTVSLGGAITAGTITIENPGGLVTLNAATTTTLTVGSGGFDLSSATQNLDINGPIQIALAANQPWSVASGRRLATGTEISGAYVITKNGAGLLQLNNSGTFSGLTINAGSVWVVAPGAGLTTPIGARSNSTTVTIANGGKLEFQANDVIATASSINASNLPVITLNGSADNGTYLYATRYNGVGDVTLNSAWLVQASSDAGSYRGWQFIGTITSTGTSRISSINSTPNHLNGLASTTFNVTSGTLTIESSAPLIDGSPAQSGAGALTKSGAGALTVGSANTFTGAVSVTAGTLNANSATALGSTSGGGISVSLGATLSLAAGAAMTYSSRNLSIAGDGTSFSVGSLVLSDANTYTFGGIGIGSNNTFIRSTANATLAGNIANGGNSVILGSGGTGAAAATTLTINGVISGLGGLTFGNSSFDLLGTVVLSGANNYQGNTTFGGGTARANNDSAFGTGTLVFAGGAIDTSAPRAFSNLITVSSNITFGGTAALTLSAAIALGANRTITTNGSGGALTLSGVVSGTGFSLTKAGTNTLILSGANNYSGGTTIRAGTVVAGNANALGSSGTVTLNDASTGSANTSLLLNSVTVSRAITVANQGSGTTTLGANGAVAFPTFSGAITLAKAVTLDGSTNTDRLTFTGGIGGTGNVTIVGTKRVVFDTTANTYAGTTTINSGAILQLGTGASTALSFLPDGYSVAVYGTLNFAKGSNSETIDALTGSGVVDNPVAGAATLIVGSAGGSGSFSGVIKNTAGTLGLTKQGAGTQTLTGANTYTGATTVSVGTLNIAGSGSLGSGTYAGAITNSANLTFSTSTAQTLSGAIGGTGTLTNSGAGTLTLSAVSGARSTANALSGALFNIGGSSTNFYTLSGDVSNINGAVTFSGLVDNITSSQGSTLGAFTQALVSGTGVVLIGNEAGNSTYNMGSFAGTGIVAGSGYNAARTGTKTLSVGALNTDTTYAGVIADQYSGGGSVVAFTKVGTGTQTLSGTNTYTGGTTISAGTLRAASTAALGTGNVSLSAGTTLQSMTAGGQQGKLTIGGNLTNSAGGSIRIGG